MLEWRGMFFDIFCNVVFRQFGADLRHDVGTGSLPESKSEFLNDF